MDQFQPYPTQGGGDRIPPGRWSLVIPLWMLKISSNFMTLFLWTFAISHWSQKKKFEILKNWNFFLRPFQHQRVPPLKFFFSKLIFPLFQQQIILFLSLLHAFFSFYHLIWPILSWHVSFTLSPLYYYWL